MVDPEGLVILGTTADLARRILGPLADYLGSELKCLAELRVDNLKRIFEHAGQKLGTDGIGRPGGVPLRVLREVLEEGSFRSDPLGVEYFGGVLAAAKSEIHRDDRAATLVSLVGQLSTYQLRAHYVMYAHARNLLVGQTLELGIEDIRKEFRIYIPASAWSESMAFSALETAEFDEISGHCGGGLKGCDLIGESFAVGLEADGFSRFFEGREFPEDGVVFTLAPRGIELFTFAHGLRTSPETVFLSPDVDLEFEADVTLSKEAVLLRDLPLRRDG